MRLFTALRPRKRRCDNCVHWFSLDRQRGRCDRIDADGMHPGKAFSGEMQLTLPFYGAFFDGVAPDGTGQQYGLSYARPNPDEPLRPIRAADQSCAEFSPVSVIERFEPAPDREPAE
ncbi:MAG: hypothetical protein WA908_01650 [Pontixanthobacter sp.]